jgi:hypothetical protein
MYIIQADTQSFKAEKNRIKNGIKNGYENI